MPHLKLLGSHLVLCLPGRLQSLRIGKHRFGSCVKHSASNASHMPWRSILPAPCFPALPQALSFQVRGRIFDVRAPSLASPRHSKICQLNLPVLDLHKALQVDCTAPDCAVLAGFQPPPPNPMLVHSLPAQGWKETASPCQGAQSLASKFFSGMMECGGGRSIPQPLTLLSGSISRSLTFTRLSQWIARPLSLLRGSTSSQLPTSSPQPLTLLSCSILGQRVPSTSPPPHLAKPLDFPVLNLHKALQMDRVTLYLACISYENNICPSAPHLAEPLDLPVLDLHRALQMDHSVPHLAQALNVPVLDLHKALHKDCLTPHLAQVLILKPASPLWHEYLQS